MTDKQQGGDGGVFQISNGEGVFLPLCPVCKTQFGSFSSMKSHLRNKKDVEHKKYRSDEEKTTAGKKMPPGPQGGGEDEPPVKKRHRLDCPAHVRASSFLGSLGVSPAFLDAANNSCFCEQCANGLPASRLQCAQIYELPHGYVGFGIQMGPRATSLRIFEDWPVSYHGLKAANLGRLPLS